MEIGFVIMWAPVYDRIAVADELARFGKTNLVDALQHRAVAVAQQRFMELSFNLLAAITKSGLSAALPYCSEKALPITRKLAEKHGVEPQADHAQAAQPGKSSH